MKRFYVKKLKKNKEGAFDKEYYEELKYFT